MACNLTGIYAVLAAWAFTVDSVSVTCRYGATLKGSVAAADCPVRLLLPVNTGLEGDNIRPVTFGSAGEAVWVLDDLLLIKPATQSRGLEDVAPLLVQYVQDYTNKIVTSGKNVTARAFVESADIATGIYEWPSGSEVAYYGARASLTIREAF